MHPYACMHTRAQAGQGSRCRAAVRPQTRASSPNPRLVLPSAAAAAAVKAWCDDEANDDGEAAKSAVEEEEGDRGKEGPRRPNWAAMKAAFESTTSFGKLRSADATVAGRNVFLRLTCFAGDAMGMNMVSKVNE